MTAIYSAEDNSLTEQPEMEEPLLRPSDYQIGSYFHTKSRSYWQEYNDHIATLRTISCHESCRGLWKTGDKLVEGKDYELRQVPCPYFDHIDDPVEYSTEALPLVPVKSEDDLWLKMLQMVFEHHVSGYDANMDYNSAIAELKQKYSLSRK